MQNTSMPAKLSIGDFSRMTHLSVKALRHYHDLGLLEPADVNPQTGYRSYDTAQVPAAQVIRRFRDLGMPVEHVKAILAAPDLAARNALIVAHLRRLESQLEQTQSSVSSLRRLLEAAPMAVPVEYRSVAAIRAASITKSVALGEIEPWWSNAFAEIERVMRAAQVRPAGPRGGLYPTELFADELGEVTVFVPVAEPFEAAETRVRLIYIPPAELALAVHAGPLREADRTYGSLGTHVAERAIGVEGPIRENYLVTDDDVADESGLRTEIGWPVFRIEPRR
jgi:DNA-binding transcriptional MerR regulator